ncbi:MAG TPA: hypothetical protein QF720_04210 [Nitrospinota bacterium]|nr:hypothetical protein [Nitrospinota bacterium]|tara:strand:- start:37496 stop:37780 length:285 start_codon:yes stop_codon:yes gene_type:complete
MKIQGYLLLVFVVLFSACSSVTLKVEEKHAISANKIDRLGRGTTVAQVRRILGTPETIIKTKRGEFYFYKDLSLKSCWVELTHEGIVQDIEWSD